MGSRIYHPSRASWFGRFWTYFITEPMTRFDREHRAYLDSPEGKRFDWKVMVVFITVAFILTVKEFLGGVGVCRMIGWLLDALRLPDVADRVLPHIRNPTTGAFEFTPKASTDYSNDRLVGLTYFNVGDLLLYFLLPVLMIKLVFREKLGDFGLKFSGAFEDWWIYVVMFAVVLPLVFVVSTSKSFQECYPYYQPPKGEPLWPRFWFWEFQYLLSFLCIEFLFRGFMVHATKRRLGVYAIFAMMVPYVMVHFRKPFLECLGSILAGIGLGYMSLKTRSIWMGTSLHIFVAFSMDMASLWRQGRFD